jgi:DUF2948 family protein
MTAALKLRAEDEEDLAIISAILQDALVAVSEIAWLPEDKRFVLMANRFRWEPPAEGPRRDFERRLCGLRVDDVRAVRRRGFHPREEDRLLVLLALRTEPGVLYLDFAGGSSIRLEVGRILCHLEDFGEPWPTKWRPRHPVEDSE